MKKILKYLKRHSLVRSNNAKLTNFESQIKNEYKFNIKVNQKQKKRIYNHIKEINSHNLSSKFKFKYAIAAIVVVVFSLTSIVALAQKSKPGDNLYSIKKISQAVRLWLQPDYIKSTVPESKLKTEKSIENNTSESNVDKSKHEYSNNIERAIDSGYSKQIENDTNGSIIENYTNLNIESSKSTSNNGPIENNAQPTPTNNQSNKNNKNN